jgi:tetratricopeptide (TPR) repeat protein
VTGAKPRTFGIVGPLAAFPRRIAAREVERAGGRLLRGITRQTTQVVLGRGLLAKAADAAIEVQVDCERAAGRELLSENAFLRLLGLLDSSERPGLRRASLLEQSRLAAHDLDLLALFDAFEGDGDLYTFRDLILARKYAGLIAGGASWGAIVRSIHRFGPAVSLTAKSLQVGGGRSIYARHGDRLVELDGQLLLDLDEPADDPDELFTEAEEAEEAGDHAEAIALYGRCLAIDPGDAVAAFNRANCLRAIGELSEAEAEYARALRSDARFVEAWFNLAALARERGRTDAARRYLERAVAVDAEYGDAVFNLASLEFDSGNYQAARRWWRRYLEVDATSEWARVARHGLRFIAMKLASSAGEEPQSG